MIDITKYGLQLVRVDLPFRLNHVNCFLAEGDEGWTLIDTGLHNEEAIKIWEKELSGKKLEKIIVTHEHPDHIGSSGYLQKSYKSDVYMTKKTEEFGAYFMKEERVSQLKANYLKSAVPERVIKELLKANEKMKQALTPLPTASHYLEEKDSILIGDLTYEVIFTPGHAEGLITLYNEEENVLIATDHILPKITPNISYWFHGDDNPLQTYINSLLKIKQLNVSLVIPSHGKPFYDANERIDEIMSHHDERLDFMLDIIKDTHSVYDITNKMFNKKLTTHELRFAIGEAIAHLEYLRHKGECVREEVDKVWSYKVKR